MSSILAAYTAPKAFDGNYANFWHSYGSGPSTVKVVFDSPRAVNSVSLFKRISGEQQINERYGGLCVYVKASLCTSNDDENSFFKNAILTSSKCTTSSVGDPFVDSVNSTLLKFPFEFPDIDEIYITFDKIANVAEIEVSSN